MNLLLKNRAFAHSVWDVATNTMKLDPTHEAFERALLLGHYSVVKAMVGTLIDESEISKHLEELKLINHFGNCIYRKRAMGLIEKLLTRVSNEYRGV